MLWLVFCFVEVVGTFLSACYSEKLHPRESVFEALAITSSL